MNKRKIKKKYKKQYGKQHVYLQENRIKSWHQYSLDIMEKIKKGIEKVVKQIKEMPENEFQEKIENLTPEQKILAKKIRGGKTK